MGRKPAVCTMGGAIIRRFALFPLMLLMLLLLPARMAAQKAASSSNYIATYNSTTQTLTFKKFVGETLPSNSVVVEKGNKVFEINRKLGIENKTIVHIVFDKSFNTYSPTSLYQFFLNLRKLETIKGLEYLNTERVTNMSCMFYDCSSLTSLDVTKFNTTNVTDMNNMFFGCSSLTSLDVTKFNTANVKSMGFMFYGCSSLTSLKVTNLNTANVTNMNSMFYGCSSLTSLNVTSLNTSNVTDMYSMFYGCSSLSSLDVTNFNTANVTKMSAMFQKCSSLRSLDLTKFNTANVTTMESMFSGCLELTTISASSKFVTTQVSNSNSMFFNCKKLKGNIEWTSDKATDKTYAKIEGGYFSTTVRRPWVKYADGTLTFYNSFKDALGENEYELNSGANLPEWVKHKKEITKVVFDTSFADAKPTSCYGWFDWCEKLKQIEGIKNLNTEMATDMSSMFSTCVGLKSLDVTNFNTANVKDMENMFSSCRNLPSLNVTNFNTANVTNMQRMFASCTSLTSLDVTNFNTENVTSMSGMFDSCSGLVSLDVTNFNTANVTDMSDMFYGCYKLKEIYVSDKFVTDGVISSGYMFWGCNSLSGDIDWKSVKVSNKTYAKTAGGYFRDKAYDNRPWVKYADGTLTFRCGYKKTLGENEYALNSGENLPAWYTHNNNINLVVFDASFANAKPTSCYAWFQDFKNLTQIEGIENLNTANVTDMNGMFKGCSNLAELDVTHFNTANVTNMNEMFSDCQTLTTIYVSDEFVITNITDKGDGLFSGCIKLKGAIDKYDASKTNYNIANYKTGYFTKLVGKNGDEKIGAAGKTLTAENLALDDNKDFVAYEPFAATEASYSRDIPKGSKWGTLCLPFAIDQSKETECKFYRLTGIDNDCITLESCEEGKIPAGTPVLFKMNEGEQTLSISAQNADLVIEPVPGTNTDVNLVGSFTKIGGKDNKGLDDNDYIISKNKFWRVADLTGGKGVGSKPMHAYIHPATASQARAAILSIGKGDGTTAIDNLNAISNDANAEYYDANGRRTNGLQKGLNIVKRGSKTYKIMVK